MQKADCYHFSGTTKDDEGPPCTFNQTPWIIFMGALQLIFSQIQDIDRCATGAILPTIDHAAGGKAILCSLRYSICEVAKGPPVKI